MINVDIKINIITDKKELNDKGHDYPVLELYNDIIDVWIPIEDLSFKKLQHEIIHIKKVSNDYLEKVKFNSQYGKFSENILQSLDK